MSSTRVQYNGSVPGADANDYVLFSTDGLPSGWLQTTGNKRFFLCLNNPQTCTLKDYFSDDGGTTWKLRSTTVVNAMTTTTNDYDYYIEPFKDWRLVLTNGGSAQTGLAPQMSLSTERSAAV